MRGHLIKMLFFAIMCYCVKQNIKFISLISWSFIMTEKLDDVKTCCKETCCSDGCCSEDCNTGDCSTSCCIQKCCTDSDTCC